MNIFTLTGKILVDSADAQNSISKTGEQAEGLGAKLAGGIATAAKWGAAVTAAATAVGGAMLALTKGTAETFDVIDKGSQRMGIAVDTYQELAHAADLSGVKMSSMEKAAKKLSGTGVKLDAAIMQIAAIGDETARSQAAISMFGETVAYELTPLLNSGADGIASMREEANELGLVFDEDAIAAGARLNDAISKVSRSFQALKDGIAAQLMPYVEKITDWVLENMPLIRDTVSNVIDAIMPIVSTALSLIMEMLPPIMGLIKSILDWILPYLRPILDAISKVVEGLFALLDGDTETFAKAILELLGALVEGLFNIGRDIILGLWEGMKSVWEDVKSWIDEKVNNIKDAFGSALTFGSQDRAMSVNGYHASGLNQVPYDGYVASLHRGESVMTAGDTNRLIDAINSIGANGQSTGPIELVVKLDSAIIARELYDANQWESTRRGAAAFVR